MWTLPCLDRQRAVRVALFMLTYPRDLSRSSEGFSRATGFPPVQLVDQVHLVRTALRASRLQAVKDGVHQSARNVTGVLCCYKPVRRVVRHTVAIPRGLLDQSLRARLGHVDRRHEATLPGLRPCLRMSSARTVRARGDQHGPKRGATEQSDRKQASQPGPPETPEQAAERARQVKAERVAKLHRTTAERVARLWRRADTLKMRGIVSEVPSADLGN